jgi:hypothetical protein
MYMARLLYTPRPRPHRRSIAALESRTETPARETLRSLTLIPPQRAIRLERVFLLNPDPALDIGSRRLHAIRPRTVPANVGCSPSALLGEPQDDESVAQMVDLLDVHDALPAARHLRDWAIEAVAIRRGDQLVDPLLGTGRVPLDDRRLPATGTRSGEVCHRRNVNRLQMVANYWRFEQPLRAHPRLPAGDP